MYKYSYKIADVSEIITLLGSQPDKYCYLSDHVIYSGEIDVFYGQSKLIVYSSKRTRTGNTKITTKDIMALNSAIERE